MADPKPRLVAITPEPEPPGSDAPTAAPAPAARGVSRRIFGVVVLLAVLLGVALAVQSQRVSELGMQVEGPAGSKPTTCGGWVALLCTFDTQTNPPLSLR